MRLTLVSKSPDNNDELARQVINTFFSARIFAFYGTLGAGKTTFIQSLCRALGVTEPVNSPTFSLVHTYLSRDAEVYHFDFYRIHAEDEAYEIGLDEYLDSGNYCFIEWPERIPRFLPTDTVHLTLTTQPDNSRKLDISHGEY